MDTINQQLWLNPPKGELEHKLLRTQPNLTIIGVDEVGRGCLAGPVVASAVTLNYHKLAQLSTKQLGLIRDSKKLSARQRQVACDLIAEVSYTSALGWSSADVITELGIVPATFAAMRQAIHSISQGGYVIVDGRQEIPQLGKDFMQTAVIKGDNQVFAIAAASIVAKQARDSYMAEQAEEFPYWGFERHVGYGTKLHMEMIREHGISPLHRRGFAPIQKALSGMKVDSLLTPPY